MAESINITNIYKKLIKLEEHVSAIEHILLPQIKVSKALTRRLEKVRSEMRRGEVVKLSAIR